MPPPANRTNEEIGRDYERYVGYLYESAGWAVVYRGIMKGMADLGRDLVCRRNKVIHIVQCKCWAERTPIRADVVAKLVTTTALYREKCHSEAQGVLAFAGFENCNVKAALVTTSVLDPPALAEAKNRRVLFREREKRREYPLIKCVKRQGCYYWPGHANYDRVALQDERGDFRCATESEAVQRGFRRAPSDFGMSLSAASRVVLGAALKTDTEQGATNKWDEHLSEEDEVLGALIELGQALKLRDCDDSQDAR